jgi:hypothetical protein
VCDYNTVEQESCSFSATSSCTRAEHLLAHAGVKQNQPLIFCFDLEAAKEVSFLLIGQHVIVDQRIIRIIAEWVCFEGLPVSHKEIIRRDNLRFMRKVLNGSSRFATRPTKMTLLDVAWQEPTCAAGDSVVLLQTRSEQAQLIALARPLCWASQEALWRPHFRQHDLAARRAALVPPDGALTIVQRFECPPSKHAECGIHVDAHPAEVRRGGLQGDKSHGELSFGFITQPPHIGMLLIVIATAWPIRTSTLESPCRWWWTCTLLFSISVESSAPMISRQRSHSSDSALHSAAK